MEKTGFKNGGKKNYFNQRQLHQRSQRESNECAMCRTQRENQAEWNGRELGWAGEIEHQITEDLQSQTDKFRLKYSCRHGAVKCFYAGYFSRPLETNSIVVLVTILMVNVLPYLYISPYVITITLALVESSIFLFQFFLH